MHAYTGHQLLALRLLATKNEIVVIIRGKDCQPTTQRHPGDWRSLFPLLGLPLLALFCVPVEAIPANIRNSTTPSASLVRILANPSEYNGKFVDLKNINVQCMGSICSISAGGQSLLLDNTSLSASDRQRLLKCVPLGCAASIRGSVSSLGSFSGMGVPVLSVKTLSFSGQSAPGSTISSSSQPIESIPSGPSPTRVNLAPSTTKSSASQAGSVCLPENRTLSLMEMGVLAARESRNPSPKIAPPTWPAQASASEQLQARKQLASIGMSWDSKLFLDALLNGDSMAIDLYLKGGMTPYTEYAGQAVIFYLLAQNKPAASTVLANLLKQGLDPNATVATNACPSCFPKQQTLLQITKRYRHPKLTDLLVTAGAQASSQCRQSSRSVKGTASGATTARAPGSATDSAARPQPTARTTGQACLLPPVMTGPPTAADLKAGRVLFVSDNQMRGQLAALEGTRWRYPAVGMTGNEWQKSGTTTTELQFGPDRLVTMRSVSEKQGTTEYRYRAIVVDEEPGLDQQCDWGVSARPDGSFAGSQGRRVRRQLILRPLDGKGVETELSIGYWGGNTLYVGESVRWQYFITPATLVSGTPKALKPLPSGAAVTRPSTQLAARIGDLGVLPNGIDWYCDTMLWRQSAAIKTARQLAGLRDKGQLQLVMADLSNVGGKDERMTLIRFDGRMMNLAAVNAGGKTVLKSGDLLVTRRHVGQYALPDEPGVGFGDGVLTVRHGMESLTIPYVSQSVC